MSGLASRRGFLRGLTTLPLIGGSVALLGAPSAVAAVNTDATMSRYVAWLAHEHREALIESETRRAKKAIAEHIANGHAYRPEYVDEVKQRTRQMPHMFWFPEDAAIERIVTSARPSTRAALVLSAVGCDWREGGR